MKSVFADTFYYLALMSPDDSGHSRAIAISKSIDLVQITTAWVLTEVADALADPRQRAGFGALLKLLQTDPMTRILPPTKEMFESGIALYTKRPDKEWSLTDCISFVVMQKNGLTDALTADKHFGQAGFNVLLK